MPNLSAENSRIFDFLPRLVHPDLRPVEYTVSSNGIPGGQVAVKLNSVLLSTTVPNAGAQSSNFAAYRDVIGVNSGQQLEKQHSFLNLRIRINLI